MNFSTVVHVKEKLTIKIKVYKVVGTFGGSMLSYYQFVA